LEWIYLALNKVGEYKGYDILRVDTGEYFGRSQKDDSETLMLDSIVEVRAFIDEYF
jgi:hypothetical protein